MTPQPSTPPQMVSTAAADEIIHALVILGITAASCFVKNANSQQHAVSIINLVNQVVLPLADSFLIPKPPVQ